MKSTCLNCSRRTLILGLLSGVAWFGFSPSARPELSFVFTNSTPVVMPRRPSIILIVAEGLGYGDLSCYGQTKFQTPNLDRLAAEGIRFTSYYSGNAVSSPSRAALMLGKDSSHLKQRADVDVPLMADDITVAQALKQSGYHTGLIGEWDLGDENSSGAPWKKGFDEFAGYFDPNDAGNYYADYIWRYAPESVLNPTNHQREDFIGREMLYPNTGGKQEQFIPDLYMKAILNFIQNNQPDRFNHYRPFFLLVNYKIPGAGNSPVPTDAPFSGEPWPKPEKNKAAMITRLDNYVGQLLEKLQKLRMTNNMVIFFTSDAGPQTNGIDPRFFKSAGPFRGHFADPYEGGLRVPMIVYWPGKISAGQVSDFPCAAWDFLPTAADIALIRSPTNIDGISIRPTLFGQTQTNRHETFHWELKNGRNVWHTVRLEDWQVVQPKINAPPELYNLKTDPGETNNVANQHPDIITRFQDILKNSH
jgi:arylsulfatase A-like enzyme